MTQGYGAVCQVSGQLAAMTAGMAPMVLTLVCLQVAMFVVYAATFSGFIISIVQFINVMTKV